MKKDVSLPQIPTNLSPELTDFCKSTLKLIKDLRLETSQILDTRETDWILCSDWTNAEFTLSHNLNTALKNLYVKFLISTDGTDNNSFEIFSAGYNTAIADNTIWGINVYQIDINNIKVQTGSQGILQILDDASADFIDNESYYYNIIAYKLR